MTTERIEEKQTVLADIVAQTISEWAENWTRTRAVSDRNGGEFKIPGCQWRFSADRPSDEEVEEPESVLQFIPTFQRGMLWKLLKKLALTRIKFRGCSSIEPLSVQMYRQIIVNPGTL